jgi:pilus assembly protein CpaE
VTDTPMNIDSQGLVIVDDDDEFLAEAKSLFEGRAPIAHSLADVQRQVEEGTVDLVVLGPTYAHESGLKEASLLLDVDPDLAVILVAGTITAPLLKAALRAGLKDVIEAPLTAPKVTDTLNQVERHQRRATAAAVPAAPAAPAPPAPKEGTVITVMSAKGGSGKTVVATNLAMLLTRHTDPKRVAIVDADLQFGDVGLVLQLEPKLTLVNAAHELHRLDDSLLESLMVRHPSGLRVLAAPLEPAFADEVSTAAMTEILQRLRTMFEYVVVDTASLLDELLLSILERSDQVLLVVDMDLPSIKNAKLALETLRLLKFPLGKIKVILNRGNAKVRLDVSEIERSLQMKVTAAVPSDAMVPASVNEGVPVVVSNPKSKVAKGFEGVLQAVLGKNASSSETKRRWH